MGRLVLVDTDAGIDDAWALLMVLAAEAEGRGVRVLGVTCGHGNTTVDHVCVNVLRTLEAAGRLDVPVFRGATTSLVERDDELEKPSKPFFGEDGFGCAEHDSTPDATMISEESAISALNRIVGDHKGEVSLLCCGPLTNVALAIRTYGDFQDDLKEVMIMGGNHTGEGNATDCAEYNFFADPEAADIVLGSRIRRKVMVPWETCRDGAEFSLEWRDGVLGACDNRGVRLLNLAERALRAKPSFRSWMCCDQVVAAVLIAPAVQVSGRAVHARVELHGCRTRGQVVVSHRLRGEPNVELVTAIDQPLLARLLLDIHRL